MKDNEEAVSLIFVDEVITTIKGSDKSWSNKLVKIVLKILTCNL